jgi:hypothetical protein
MPGLVPGIHEFHDDGDKKTWIAGTSSAMTINAALPLADLPQRFPFQAHSMKSAFTNVVVLCTSIWKSALPLPSVSPETMAMWVVALNLTCSSPAK